MSLQIHELWGCAPAPLASYLKALGVLRLVVDQGADEGARGWWEDEHFRLMTKLTREELEGFFLEKYEPTPLLSPWNKGCGFFKADDVGLGPLERSRAPRFGRFREGVAAARGLLNTVEGADAVIRAIKARTKTNKSFQTEKQRGVLKESEAWSACVAQVEAVIARGDANEEERAEAMGELEILNRLVSQSEKPPTAAEAKELKESKGYKRILAVAERRFKALKAELIPDCRRQWRAGLGAWFGAAVVLDEEGNPVWPALLGTGGNDGNLDFTNNFMQRLGELFEVESDEGRGRGNARELLANSLWLSPTNGLRESAVGQYSPGSVGGANSTTGADGAGLVNGWEFVLMMEGVVLFSSRVTRRLDPGALKRVAAPFAVRAQAAGHNSPGSEKAQRGEQWMPLWGRAAGLGEVRALMGEGRVQLDRETANRPIEAARAIGRLGAARGVSSFVRYGYLERNGQSTLAVPLGRVGVRESGRGRLVDDIAAWMDRLQRVARGKLAPARLVQGERRLADAVMAALMHDETDERWQAVLLAAVNIERMQAGGSGIEAGPIPELSMGWVSAIGESAEVRLAAALGSAAGGYRRDGGGWDPVRHHWLPLERGGRRFRVTERRLAQDPRVVMGGMDGVTDCVATIERRIVEAGMKGARRLELVAAPGYEARLEDVAALVGGGIELGRVVELARALMAVRWRAGGRGQREGAGREMPPEPWLAMKLACLPWPVMEREIPVEAGMVRRLEAGDSAGALGVALSRLRAAGIRPPMQGVVTDARTARLWAAALVFPISKGSARRAAAAIDPTLKGNGNG